MGYGSVNSFHLGNFPVLLSLHKAGFQATKLLGGKCGKRLTQLSQQKLPILVCLALEQNLLSRADRLWKVILYLRGLIQGICVYPQISAGIIIESMFFPKRSGNLVRYLYEDVLVIERIVVFSQIDTLH